MQRASCQLREREKTKIDCGQQRRRQCARRTTGKTSTACSCLSKPLGSPGARCPQRQHGERRQLKMMVCVCLGEAVEVGAVASSSMGWCEATDGTYPLQHLEHGVERGEVKCEVKLQLHQTKYPLGMAQRHPVKHRIVIWERRPTHLHLSLRSNPALA